MIAERAYRYFETFLHDVSRIMREEGLISGISTVKVSSWRFREREREREKERLRLREISEYVADLFVGWVRLSS